MALVKANVELLEEVVLAAVVSFEEGLALVIELCDKVDTG